MSIFNLLAAASETISSASSSVVTNASPKSPSWTTWVIWGVVIVAMIAYFIFSNKKRKQYQEETQEKLNSIAQGDYIKTIGRICGTVQEVLDDGTIVLLTGSENYPSYIRIDREAIAEFKKPKENQEDPFTEVTPSEEVSENVQPLEIQTENAENNSAEQEVSEVSEVSEETEIPTSDDE